MDTAPKSIEEFKNKFAIDQRKKCSNDLRSKYPEHVPVVLERVKITDPDLTQKLFMVPKDSNVNSFVQKLKNGTKSLILFFYLFPANNNTHLKDQKFSEIDESCKDEDGFVYLRYGSSAIIDSHTPSTFNFNFGSQFNTPRTGEDSKSNNSNSKNSQSNQTKT